jgi:hypothetical protein
MSYPCLSNASSSVVVAGCSIGLCVVMICYMSHLSNISTSVVSAEYSIGLCFVMGCYLFNISTFVVGVGCGVGLYVIGLSSIAYKH